MVKNSYKILPIISHNQAKEAEYRKNILVYTNMLKKGVKEQVYPYMSKRDISRLYSLDSDEYVYDVDIENKLDDILDKIKSEGFTTEQLLLIKMRLIGSGLTNTIIDKFRKDLNVSKVKLADNLRVNILSDNNRTINKLLNSWISTNTRLIKSIPVEMLDDVALVINYGFSNGSSIRSIQEQLQIKFKISKNRAALIARDQIAKLASDVLRHESLEIGAENYIWATSHDDRVRASHRVLDGKICSWNDPNIYKNSVSDTKWLNRASIGGVLKHVGQDFQCRCSARIIIPQRNN